MCFFKNSFNKKKNQHFKPLSHKQLYKYVARIKQSNMSGIMIKIRYLKYLFKE